MKYYKANMALMPDKLCRVKGLADPEGEISGGADGLYKRISDKRKTADPKQK